MRTLLILLMLISCKIVQAQQQPSVNIKPNLLQKDTIIVNAFPNLHQLQPSVRNMPNPYKSMPNQLTKIGTTGTGFDLYQSKPDNMMVIKPDSLTLAENKMPNGYTGGNKMSILRNPKPKVIIETLPENGQKK